MDQILVFSFERQFHVEDTNVVTSLLGLEGGYLFINPFTGMEFEEGEFAGYHIVILRVKMGDIVSSGPESDDFFRDLEKAMGPDKDRSTFAGRMVEVARKSAYNMRYNEANVGLPALWTDDKDMGDGLSPLQGSGYFQIQPSVSDLIGFGYCYPDATGGFSVFDLLSDDGIDPQSGYKVNCLLTDEDAASMESNVLTSFSSNGLTVDRKVLSYDSASNTYKVTNI